MSLAHLRQKQNLTRANSNKHTADSVIWGGLTCA